MYVPVCACLCIYAYMYEDSESLLRVFLDNLIFIYTEAVALSLMNWLPHHESHPLRTK